MAVYTAADWHGCSWIWEKVKEILQPNDKLYFLGDSIDRGPDGWKLLNELLEDPRVIYLKGNHEDMMVETLNYVDGHIRYNEYTSWWYNSCYSTIDNMEEDTRSDEEIWQVIKKVDALPFCAAYINTQNQRILLCHAGCDGFEYADDADEHKLLWDRSHWMYADDWYGKEDEYVVHGHTPIELMREDQIKNAKYYGYGIEVPEYSSHGAYWYGRGHKVCIDTGAVWNNESVLLNLDTWEEIIIRKDED